MCFAPATNLMSYHHSVVRINLPDSGGHRSASIGSLILIAQCYVYGNLCRHSLVMYGARSRGHAEHDERAGAQHDSNDCGRRYCRLCLLRIPYKWVYAYLHAFMINECVDYVRVCMYVSQHARM